MNMRDNKTKNRKLSASERQAREKRSARLRGLAVLGVVALTGGSLFGMAQMNKYDAPKTDLWISEDAPQVEVAAQPEGYGFMLAGSAAQVYTAAMTAEIDAGDAEIDAGDAEDEAGAPAEDAVELPPSRRDADADEPGEEENAGAEEAEAEETVSAAASNPRSAENRPDSIIITATGDITLGGNVSSHGDDYFDAYVQKYGYGYFLQNFAEMFSLDDLTLVNLEGPLTGSEDKRSGRDFNFRGRTEYVNILSYGNVDVANMANNHALDYGKSGLAETAAVLDVKGIGVCGWGVAYNTTIKGARVTCLGFTEWDYKESDIVNAIQSARRDCDLLIVSMHWGIEKQYKTTSKMRSLAHAAVDAGADLVIGNHPHVVGGIELYNGKYICYSLGNFCFGGNKNPFDVRCMLFQQEFQVNMDGSVTDLGINLIPAYVTSSGSTNNFQPTPASGAEGLEILKIAVRNSSVAGSQVKWMEDSYPVQAGLVAVTAKAE